MMMLWITTLCVAVVVMIYVYLSYRRLESSETKAMLQEIHERYEKRSSSRKRWSGTSPLPAFGRPQEDMALIQSEDPLNFRCIYELLLSDPTLQYIVWSRHSTNPSLVEQSRDTFMTFCYDPTTATFHPDFGIFQRSQFTMEFLFYLVDQADDPMKKWMEAMHRIGFTPYTLRDRASASHGQQRPWYTYFFTIHVSPTIPTACTYYGSYLLNNRLFATDRPIVFQTWIDHATDNEYLWRCYEKTRHVYAKHPYKLFSDFEMKRFVREYYDEDVVRQYDNIIPSAFKSDFFRYLFMYKFGGLYMDISVMPILNVFDYLDMDTGSNALSFMSATDNGHSTRLWNGLMYATPGHPFMKYCIDQIMRLRKSMFKHCLYYTGPALLGEAVSVLGRANPSYKLLRFLDGDYITDPETGARLFTPKAVDGWRSHKRITKDMYKESSKSHYSMHCLYNQVLYY